MSAALAPAAPVVMRPNPPESRRVCCGQAVRFYQRYTHSNQGDILTERILARCRRCGWELLTVIEAGVQDPDLEHDDVRAMVAE
jgi:hypothetical protein